MVQKKKMAKKVRKLKQEGLLKCSADENIRLAMELVSRCPYCGAGMSLKDAAFVYESKPDDEYKGDVDYKDKKVYVCNNFPSCDSYIRTNKIEKRMDKIPVKEALAKPDKYLVADRINHKTGETEKRVYKVIYKPLGKPANGELRLLRKECHYYIERALRVGIFNSEGTVRIWIDDALGMPGRNAHIAIMSDVQCKRMIEEIVKILVNSKKTVGHFITPFSDPNTKTYTYQNKSLFNMIEKYNKERSGLDYGKYIDYKE